MKQLQAMTASVMYQGVSVAQNVNLLHLDTEKAGLAMDAPLPVATELTLELSFSGDAVRGSAIVTRVQESRASDEKGQMHVRWVEFSDPDLERLSHWLAKTDDHLSVQSEAAPVATALDVTLPMPAAPEESASAAPGENEIPQSPPTEPSPGAIPAPSDEEERTVPLDTATQVDIPAVTDSTPSVEEENSANAGEDASPSPGGENGDAEGGDKKKRRRRKK